MSMLPSATTQREPPHFDIKTIRRLFIAGCFLLPFLWGVAAIHYRKKVRRALTIGGLIRTLDFDIAAERPRILWWAEATADAALDTASAWRRR